MGTALAIDTPRLALRRWNGGSPRKGIIYYDTDLHKELPHVVKFSGGRSSGLLLISLLNNNMLKPSRGDVVLFTNTSAEHPATYDFVRKIKKVSEDAGIPFFIAELQTYETVQNGEWRRRITYRLANSQPYDKNKNPQGYKYRGEVFEESIAWGGMLPTVFTRTCTSLMKMFVTREFLSDWLSAKYEISQQGHTSEPQCDHRILHKLHLRNRGTMTFSDFSKRWKKLNRCKTNRARQRFSDYTKAKIVGVPNDHLIDHIYGGKCKLFGDSPASFITLLGFRAGEDARYHRMKKRNDGMRTPGHETHPPGEYSYAPLFDLGIEQGKVKAFWRKQKRSIRPYLPEDINLSNCVYCFLKGQKSIVGIINKKREYEKKVPLTLRKQCSKRNTPNSIGWWIKLEETYARESRKKGSNGEEAPRFGMFGLSNRGYKHIRGNSKHKHAICESDYSDLGVTINCECTD